MEVLGEAVHGLRKRAMLDEADAWISCQKQGQKRVPTKDGQFYWRTLQTENMVEGGTESRLIQQAMKSVVKGLKLSTFLAERPAKVDLESTTND